MKRGPVIAVVAGSVAAAAVLAVGGWWLLSRPAGPEATAHEYIEALARGDAPAAVALTDLDGADATRATDAFAGASALISAPEVTDTATDGDTASVSIAYSLGGEALTTHLVLTSEDGVWTVTSSGVGTVAVTSSLGDAGAVGSVIVTADETILALPARYDVIAAPVGILTGTTTVAVVPGAAVTAALTPVLSDAAHGLASAEVEAYLAQCTRPAASVPDDCGIRVPWAADLATLESISFRIETPPTLSFTDDLTSFAATGGILVATATGVTRGGSEGAFTYRADDWSLRGGMAFSGNEMVLTVD